MIEGYLRPSSHLTKHWLYSPISVRLFNYFISSQNHQLCKAFPRTVEILDFALTYPNPFILAIELSVLSDISIWNFEMLKNCMSVIISIEDLPRYSTVSRINYDVCVLWPKRPALHTYVIFCNPATALSTKSSHLIGWPLIPGNLYLGA